jgi:nitric oxide dioxygenase
MYEDDLVLIRQSFDELWPASRRFATLFYDHLFEHAPETRLLFRGDLDRQRSRLLTMITVMVGSLDQPDVFESIVADLTTRHADYGVRPEHFGPFEEALISSLSDCLGPAFRPENEAAWRRLFQTLDPSAHANAGVRSRPE